MLFYVKLSGNLQIVSRNVGVWRTFVALFFNVPCVPFINVIFIVCFLKVIHFLG